MNHLKIIGSIAGFLAVLAVMFIAAPALISATNTGAVILGFVLIAAVVYLAGYLLYTGYKSLNNKDEEIE